MAKIDSRGLMKSRCEICGHLTKTTWEMRIGYIGNIFSCKRCLFEIDKFITNRQENGCFDLDDNYI